MDGCKDQTSHSLAVLEHVVCKVTLKHNPRGSLHLVLISPMGTRSSLLLPRLYIYQVYSNLSDRKLIQNISWLIEFQTQACKLQKTNKDVSDLNICLAFSYHHARSWEKLAIITEKPMQQSPKCFLRGCLIFLSSCYLEKMGRKIQIFMTSFMVICIKLTCS